MRILLIGGLCTLFAVTYFLQSPPRQVSTITLASLRADLAKERATEDEVREKLRAETSLVRNAEDVTALREMLGQSQARIRALQSQIDAQTQTR